MTGYSDEQIEADLAALEFRRLNPGNVAGEDWTHISARLSRAVPSLLARAQQAEAAVAERLRQFNAAKDQRDAALAEADRLRAELAEAQHTADHNADAVNENADMIVRLRAELADANAEADELRRLLLNETYRPEGGEIVMRELAEAKAALHAALVRETTLAAQVAAVRRLCDLIGDGSDEGLPTAYALACLIRGQINPDRALAVPLDTPEGETAARGENVYFDPSLASDSTILEAARPYCKHGVLPADACALCSPVGSPEGETAKPKCPRCKDSGLLWDITTTNGGGGSLSRPCPCGCNPLVLRNSPVGSSGGPQ